jgi:hypothetical protein
VKPPFWLPAIVLVVTATLSIAAEPTPATLDCATRPAWCLKGYVCVPTLCAANDAAQLELLSAEVESLAKKKAPRRWGCQLGAGMGVTLQADAGDVSFDAAPILGAVTCGWNF